MHLDWKSFSRNIATCVILAKNKKQVLGTGTFDKQKMDTLDV